MQPQAILSQYWKYDHFRPGQEEVVDAILQGKHVLALFPTGGGKSICFQVPGLMLPGVTLVVSPLIALMKDQVESLQKRDIHAVALHSGMSWKEIRLTLDNALKGRYKFIYVSPERLATENFREYLPNLNISLLVVDEAHCISQWGYDFRPEYLSLGELHEYLSNVPVAAFTASAPPLVQQDIADKLKLRNPFVYQAPFRRSNLRYHAIETENKSGLLLRALSRNQGSSIVFCDTRRETEELSRFLSSKGIAADFYHAGLKAALRSRKQDLWMRNQTRVMVCTNAFGMGVDKPDVRAVYHLMPPISPEAYYQEAGRAGRDGETSWCLLFYRQHDFEDLRQRVLLTFPDSEELMRVYNAVCNYFEIIAGMGLNQTFEFDLMAIADRYKLNPGTLHHAVANLELLGFWSLSDGFYSPSKLLFTANYEEVYDFKLRHKQAELLIDVLLRSYGGVFGQAVKLNETVIAKRLRISEAQLIVLLGQLQKTGILEYSPATDKPRITFREPRSPYPIINAANLEPLKQNRLKQIGIMHQYVAEKRCRAIFWESYFGAENGTECGVCDVCVNRKKQVLDKAATARWEQEIEHRLNAKPISRTDLMASFPAEYAFELREMLRWLMDQKKVLLDANQQLYWNR